MKNRYNIKTNPPNLSSEQIEQHRDFDALLKAFEQTPAAEPNTPSEATAPTMQVERSKRRPFLLYAVTAAAAAVLLIVALRQNRGASIAAPVPPTAQMAELLDLQVPLPHIQKPAERRTIADAAKGETLHYPSGSEIVVPAAAFIDAEGRPVEGAVEIEYREFADAIDMFLAGVPQQLGKHQNLQSTGMMEIKGFQNGEPVYLNMDKKLNVNLRGRMAADTDPSELGVYVYSTQEDAWQYEGKDRIERLETTTDPAVNNATPVISPEAQQAAEQTLASSRPPKPIEPGISNDMQVFDFDIDLNDFPELAAYDSNVEFIGAKDALTPATFDTVWNAMKIVGKGNQTYELQLVYETEGEPIVRKFKVYPAIASTPEARAAYEAQQAEYETALAAWEAEVTELALEQTPALPQQLVGIINHFSIRRFGLWNCGKPIEWNERMPVATQFVSEEGLPLDVAQVFVTTPAQQLYYSAPSQTANTAELQYTQTATPTIWAMSNDGGLWVASSPTTPEEGNSTIPMKGLAIPNTEQDLRTMLVM